MQYLDSKYWYPDAREKTPMDLEPEDWQVGEVPNVFYSGELPIPTIKTNIQDHIESMAMSTDAYSLYNNIPLEAIPFKDFTPPSGGWWRDDGTKVDYPDEEILFYDTETFVKSHWNMPIIATASGVHNYIWLHDAIFSGEYSPVFLSLGEKVKLTIAHSARFDNCRVVEFLDPNRTVYSIDTQAVAKRIVGISDSQHKAIAKAHKIGKSLYIEKFGTGVGLKNLLKFFGIAEISKETRNFFVEMEDIKEVLPNLKELLEYACLDTYYTKILFSKMKPIYEERIPLISRIGAIIRGSWSLPLGDFPSWLASCEEEFNKVNNEIIFNLNEMADEVLKLSILTPEIKEDPHLSQLDWSYTTPKMEKWEVECVWDDKIVDSFKSYSIPSGTPLPSWYSKHKKRVESGRVTTKAVDYHILTRASWDGKTILYSSGSKFHTEDGKLPHKKEGQNVGTFLNQDFNQYLGNRLTFKSKYGEILMNLTSKICYWMSARSRFLNVRYKEFDGTYWTYLDHCPNHTITGRAHSDTWSTIPKEPTFDKIGSNVKSMIQSPPGFSILCFDQNAQEARIACAMADAEKGWSCSSQISWITYTGDKTKGTDIHSIMRDYIQSRIPHAHFTRKYAKNCNYASFYFSGVATNARTIRSADPASITMEQATKASQEMLDYLRGKSMGDKYIGGIASSYFNSTLEIINSPSPSTPLLGVKCQQSLEPHVVGSDYFTSRANQPLQGAGVDMMDILVIVVEHMLKGTKSKLIMSLHDEYAAISTDEDLWESLFALQIAHMYGWAFLHWKLKIQDLPLASAWTTISVDKVLRSEPNMPIDTVSWKFGVPDGVTYGMSEIMERVNGGGEKKDIV